MIATFVTFESDTLDATRVRSRRRNRVSGPAFTEHVYFTL